MEEAAESLLFARFISVAPFLAGVTYHVVYHVRVA